MVNGCSWTLTSSLTVSRDSHVSNIQVAVIPERKDAFKSDMDYIGRMCVI